jgi:very-short-patch-repair endonuclease
MTNDKKKVARILRGIKKSAKAPLNAAKKQEYIEKQAKKMSKKMTWPEKEFKKLMKELKIDIIPQKIVMGKIYDFYEPITNTLFEIDGNYYHGDRNIYNELSSMQRRNAKNDEHKNVIALGLGYKIERIWESDLKKNYNEVKNRVKKIFKN